MDWFLLTLISIVIGSVATILQKVLMKGEKSNSYSYAIIFHFVLGIFNLLFAFIFKSEFTLDIDWLLIIVSTILWGAVTILLFRALQLLESSEVTILSSLRVVITIIAAIIFLDEDFGWLKIIGTILILLSTILVTDLKKGFKLNEGVLYVLGMVVCSALAIVVDKEIVSNYDSIAYLTISNFMICFLLILIYPKSLKIWKDFVQPDFLKKIIPLSLFSTAQSIAYLYALADKDGNASQVATIKQSQLILTILLAIVFLKERDHLLRKLITAILVTIGVILLK